MQRVIFPALSMFAVVLLFGCSGASTPKPVDSKTDSTANVETSAKESGSVSGRSTPSAAKSGEFKLGDLIEPFTPPKLAELEKMVEWTDRPVLDSLQLLREKLAKEKPLATVEESLKLHNDSLENNDKIKSALGQLPAEDSDANWDAEINRHVYSDVNSTNPILSSSVIEADVNGLLGFGLFSFDWTMNPFASKDSVATWQTSKDGLYDKIVMRNDLTWSDGKPITAHDVVFSYQVIMTSQVPVPAQRTGTDKIKWIEAYDDQTLVFFHKEALVTNVGNLNFSIIPKHAYADTIAKDPSLKSSPEHVDRENKPISGGAYTIKSRSRGQEIILERRDSYYQFEGKDVRDKPYFKTIRFRIRENAAAALLAFKAGDLDEMILNPEQWRTETNDDGFYKNATKAYATEWTSFHFVWNMEKPWFADQRVRQAMSYAFDHKELLTKLRYGLDEPCTGIFHPDSRWAPKPSPTPYQQNLEKAEELLDAAGWVDDDGDGIREKTIDGKKVRFEFEVIVVTKDDRIKICELLKQSLEQIGVACNIRPLDFTVQVERLQKKQFDAAFGGWGTGADPDTSENIWGSNQERNYSSYSNREVDRLFDEARKEFDIEKRAAKYQRISQILWNDQPYTWLYYQNAYYGFNKSLRGYNFSPRGPYHYGPGFSSIWKTAAQ